jgi:hypothetical protein
MLMQDTLIGRIMSIYVKLALFGTCINTLLVVINGEWQVASSELLATCLIILLAHISIFKWEQLFGKKEVPVDTGTIRLLASGEWMQC